VLDIEKQVTYWRESSFRAFRSVPVLQQEGFWSEALFWSHLAVENLLKAHVVKATRDTPPYIHKLLRLGELAEIDLSADQLQLCEELSKYQRLARYPDEAIQEPDAELARSLVHRAKEFHAWLLKRL